MNDPSTVTRRSALRAGTLSALGVGLMGAAGGTRNVAAAPAPPPTVPTLGTVADMAALMAESKAASQRIHEQDVAAVEARKRLRSELSPEHIALHAAVSEAEFRMTQAEEVWLVAEIARHFPGISPAIFAIADHILGDGQPTGECCI